MNAIEIQDGRWVRDGRGMLTHSRMACAKTCLRKHYLAYELGIRKENAGAPLRVGSALHLGLDLLAQGKSIDDATKAIRANYALLPPWINDKDTEREWYTERETVVVMVCNYEWRWQSAGLEIVATEIPFDLPLINPETGAESKNWRLAGKIDKIARLHDGRLAIVEHKTTGDSIDHESDYWKRLRLDSQISTYFLAARELGYDVQTVLYDVVRKPSIEPKQVPILDDAGDKIVFDANGQRVFKKDGKPRESSDKEKGYTLQTRIESPEEFAQRFHVDMQLRFDFYFAREEIPRLESDIEEFRYELWQQQLLLRDCQRNGRWYRNTAACLSPYKCEYFDICTQGINPRETLPAGFTKVDFVHPELAGELA